MTVHLSPTDTVYTKRGREEYIGGEKNWPANIKVFLLQQVRTDNYFPKFL